MSLAEKFTRKSRDPVLRTFVNPPQQAPEATGLHDIYSIPWAVRFFFFFFTT